MSRLPGETSTRIYKLAQQLQRKISLIPGAADVHLHQIVHAPEIRVNIDRTRGVLVGMSERDIAQNMLISLSSSSQTAPNFWLNPKNGVSYTVAVQTPEYKLTSMEDLQSTGLSSPTQGRSAASHQYLHRAARKFAWRGESLQCAANTGCLCHYAGP